MQFEEHEIVSITSEIPTVYTVRLKPKKRTTSFTPGQFFHLKNPTYHEPNETRPFSVTSVPANNYIEFCMKTYGPWTKTFVTKKIGESVWLFGPMGVFTLKPNMQHIVFIAGGVGITPIISILESIKNHIAFTITLIYANKSPHLILKRKQIEQLFLHKPRWKLISIVSQPQIKNTWNGFEGHITPAFIRNQVKFTEETNFFVCGSQLFTNNIVDILRSCSIDFVKIKREIFSAALPAKNNQ